MKRTLKSVILPLLITLLFGVVYFYFAIPAINIKSIELWIMVFLLIAVYLASYLLIYNRFTISEIIYFIASLFKKQNNKKRKKGNDIIVDSPKGNIPNWIKYVLIALFATVCIIAVLCIFTSSKIFRAKAYQSMLNVVESDFESDIAEIPFNQIPVVDKDTAERLGKRKIGEVVELVSQFNVSNYYSQINYNGSPYRVSPLEYAGILKWLSNRNEGIPYFVSINMATQETKLVELEEGIKYSPSEYFSRDLYRHIRFSYPTKMFENLSFEVDDNDNPYWVMSYYDYTFGIVGGKDITGVILVDAVSGEMTDYKINEIPQWIDQAYSPELLIEQADNWGTYKNGFLNSIFVQKNVVKTTDGYNYIALNDDVWLYTGITSVVADESNIGFILINMRTKEARTYMINGAEEYSAMESAQGQIQEKNYAATFPILVNIADKPTYFISLKDNAGLVKLYAFVSVAEYQIVGVSDTIEGAQKEYLRLLNIDDEEESDSEYFDRSGTVVKIATAVVDGNSKYYIKLIDDETVYVADIKLWSGLPMLSVGDIVSFKADNQGNISEFVFE